MQPALYDAINNQQVATFYIGAFWDQFLRQNCQATAGQWRVMAAPEFEEVKKAGAPVSQYTVLLDKGDNVYRELFEQMWYDYTFDAQSKEAYVNSMEEQNAPYSNPVSLDLLEEHSGKRHRIFTADSPSVRWRANAWPMEPKPGRDAPGCGGGCDYFRRA